MLCIKISLRLGYLPMLRSLGLPYHSTPRYCSKLPLFSPVIRHKKAFLSRALPLLGRKFSGGSLMTLTSCLRSAGASLKSSSLVLMSVKDGQRSSSHLGVATGGEISSPRKLVLAQYASMIK